MHWLRSLMFGALIESTCQIKLNFKTLVIYIAFASLKYLWDLKKNRMETESLPHPKWLRTNMFAHRVVSWRVEQLSCIFSVTIAAYPVPDSATGDGFCLLSPNYTYFTCRNCVCQHSVMTETTVKQRAFAFICPMSNMYWDTRLRLRRRYF